MDLTISAREIKSMHEKKYKIKLETFEKILQRVYNRIRKAVQKNLSLIYYEVPSFILGIPTYNLDECVTYILYKLDQQGYKVIFRKPNHLQIIWILETPDKLIRRVEHNVPALLDVNANQNKSITFSQLNSKNSYNTNRLLEW